MSVKPKKVIALRRPRRKPSTFTGQGGNPTLNSPIQAEAKVIRFGVGMDVHKNKIAVCVSAQIVDGSIIIHREHVFQANPSGLIEMTSFLAKYYSISAYLMECTGVYHLPVMYALRKAFPDRIDRVIAMNPLLLHHRLADLGKKADKVDARGLSTLTFYDTMLRPSYIGTMQFYRMRALIRAFHKTKREVTRIRNRLHGILHGANLKFKFDLSTEWSLQLLDRYLSRSWSFGEAFTHLLQERLKQGTSTRVLEKHATEIVPFKDVSLTEDGRFHAQMELGRYLQADCTAAIYLHRAERKVLADSEFATSYRKLLEIPGLGPVTVLTTLLELGDYRRFSKWEALVKYSGLAPVISTSSESNLKGRINRQSNKYLRTGLIQAAQRLITQKNRDSDPARYAFKQFQERKLPFKKASIKVTQKLARTIYTILVLKVPLDPNYEKATREREKRERRLKRHGSMLESSRVRALRRDVPQFLVTHYEFLNSTSRYHLKSGFYRLIRKAQFEDQKEKGEDEKK
ncbi:MAG: IS110 family transposase [Promethearchaeota archaeon]